MPLIICKINLILTWSEDYFLSFKTEVTKFLLELLSTQDNEKLLQQLKSGFKRTINWNKNQSKILTRKTKSIFRFRN